MEKLSTAGAGLVNSLSQETGPQPLTDETATAVKGADEPRVLPDESPLQPDPRDPETGQPLGSKSDESQLDPETLYKAKVHVDQGNGESATVTVGELKDLYAELTGVKKLASENEAKRDEFAREQMLARQEFDAMVAMLPPDARSPEFVEKTRERMAQHVRAETVKLLKILPEWSDPQHAEDDRRLINKHAAKWGFNADEIGLISDHRMVKYLLDNARAEVRLEGVQLKQAEHKAMKPTAKPGKRSRADKLADLTQAAHEGRLTQREAAGRVLAEALGGNTHGR